VTANGPAQQKVGDARASGRPDAGAALDEVISHYEMPLLRYVGQLLRQSAQHEAEDLVQETFLRYHRQVSHNGDDSVRNVSTWLFRVAHNLTTDAIRKRSRRNQDEARPDRPDAAPADALEEMMHRETCERALAELHRLPEEQRQLLLLRVIHGMKLREISDVTGLTIGNAGYRISEGLRELARRLKANGVI
jgi:RNA polymerase sigma-70 factor (ECF subfamily)